MKVDVQESQGVFDGFVCCEIAGESSGISDVNVITMSVC
jgi:hypothetical protein